MSEFTLDKAEWQFETAMQNYCDNLNKSKDDLTDQDIDIIWNRASNHISMFLAWLIDNDLLSEEHEENLEEIKSVKERVMTGYEYFKVICDLKLIRDDIAENVHLFMDDYYESENSGYLKEYCECLEKHKKEVLEICFDWEDYKILREEVLDPAYQKYLKMKGNN